jgi:hypothetical protein
MAEEKTEGGCEAPQTFTPDQRDVEAQGSEDSVESNESGLKKRLAMLGQNASLRKIWTVVSWTPMRCRYDPEKPPKFSMALNLLFAFVSRFSVP